MGVLYFFFKAGFGSVFETEDVSFALPWPDLLFCLFLKRREM